MNGINYLEIYNAAIAPKLKRIDTMLKTGEGTISPEDAADALYISEAEVYEIMRENGLEYIDRAAFLLIMKNGTSGLCGLYRREMELGSPEVYTSRDIAYIYNLNLDDINEAYDKLNILCAATPDMLPDIFANVVVY